MVKERDDGVRFIIANCPLYVENMVNDCYIRMSFIDYMSFMLRSRFLRALLFKVKALLWWISEKD